MSYWRRLIQARLDMLREAGRSAAEGALQGKAETLRTALGEVRPAMGRAAFLPVLPADDVPPLPDLQALWAREVLPADDKEYAALAKDLAFAELQLSAYRAALHRRLAGATAELIARYHEDPSLCLVALPSRDRRAAV